jgi:hypothetical protein
VRAIDGVTLYAISRLLFVRRILAHRKHIAGNAKETFLVHSAAMLTTLEKIASVWSARAS